MRMMVKSLILVPQLGRAELRPDAALPPNPVLFLVARHLGSKMVSLGRETNDLRAEPSPVECIISLPFTLSMDPRWSDVGLNQFCILWANSMDGS